MPRVSRQQALASRASIIDASTRLFRERGLRSVSVADVMQAAGLTHGGFYRHFASKDLLAAESCREAFDGATARWRRRATKAGAGEERAALVSYYLATRARDDVANGCPASALIVDVAREADDAPIRAAYVAGVERLLNVLAAAQQSGDPAQDRMRALADFSTMVGAIVLARATAGRTLSHEFLAAALDRLERSAPSVPSHARIGH